MCKLTLEIHFDNSMGKEKSSLNSIVYWTMTNIPHTHTICLIQTISGMTTI